MDVRAYQKQILSAAIVFAVVGFAFVFRATAQQSDPTIACEQKGVVVFSSNDTDISSFDATPYGAVLVKKVPLPNANINLYLYAPGQLFCSVKADQDTSTVDV